MKKKITIVSLSFIGAAILWFICLIASQLFFDGNVFDKGFYLEISDHSADRRLFGNPAPYVRIDLRGQ